MIFLEHPCEKCIHYRGIVNGWDIGCDAYPEGHIPNEYFKSIDVRELTECANGIKFEPKEED